MIADPDSGLLSPVRAGTPAEAATGDRAWLRALLDAEAALARAQARLGTIPPEAAEAITEAAAGEFDVVELARNARATANPVVALVKALTAKLPAETAKYVHLGSTSQDIFDTAMMLVTRRTLGPLAADLGAIAAALKDLAREHRDTPMPGRTLTAHAVPTTFGLKAAGWHQLVVDAANRVRRVLDDLPVSLGGAAGTLAAYLEYASASPDYAERLIAAFAAETGLAVPPLPWHTLRTPIADIAAALSFTTGALGKLAIDVETLSRTEIGEIAEPASPGRGGSSAMPHKRNPVLATLIRSAALQVPVLAAGLTGAMLAEDERSAGAWHAEWQLLREALRLTGGAAHTAVELARGVEVKKDRMRENLELTHGLIVSERLAAVLGKARARELLADGRPLRDVLAEAGLDDTLLDPAQYTGAAGALTDQALDED